MPEKTKPIAHVSVGSVAAAIWRNERRDTPLYTTTFNVRYKDQDNEWKTTNSFDHLTLLALAKCAHLAYDAVAALKNGDSEPNLPG
jgi:hypothetical protein